MSWLNTIPSIILLLLGQTVANIESDKELREGDKILAVNGVTVDRSNQQEMVIRMKNPTPDETIKFIVQRNVQLNDVTYDSLDSQLDSPPSPVS